MPEITRAGLAESDALRKAAIKRFGGMARPNALPPR